MTASLPTRALRAAILLAVLLVPARLSAQVRERPVAFDSAGRVVTLTPPLVARLALDDRLWPVRGDFEDARLYAIGEPAESYVIVVRRRREVVDRYPLSTGQRDELTAAVSSGSVAMRASGLADNVPTVVSEPVRGMFVANQTALGAWLFGPAAATLTGDPTAAGAAYLLVSGGSFFVSAAITQSTPVTRAQNHLAAHSAVRGAIAADLAVYAIGGEGVDDRAYSAATLAGGILGDIVGFNLARPMTDAEAHGTSHGSTVAAVLTAGALGTLGAYDGHDAMGRTAAGAVIVAGAIGYPLGLRYVRTAPYRVTGGDVGTMFVSELLGVGAAGSLIPDNASAPVGFGMLTAGYAIGAIAGDRLLVRPFDHTESDARLLALGTGAGALMGLAVPALGASGNGHVLAISATIGGILGAIATERLVEPPRAGQGEAAERVRETGALPHGDRVEVHFSPEALVLAGSGVRGRHTVLSIGF